VTREQHPANQPPVCRFPDCTAPAAGRVSWATGPFTAKPYAVVQPLTGHGAPQCLDHLHHLVDVMLLRSTPEPATTAELPGGQP
jgi:hypothetical protein